MLSKRIALRAVLLCGSIVVTGVPPVNPGIVHPGRNIAPCPEGNLVADGSPMPIPKPPDPPVAARRPPDAPGSDAQEAARPETASGLFG